MLFCWWLAGVVAHWKLQENDILTVAIWNLILERERERVHLLRVLLLPVL